jgi:predicted metal-dependent peptidase
LTRENAKRSLLRRIPEFVAGVLLHELQHLMFGHTSDPRFRYAQFPSLMELAMEASANEFITEPLPGSPVTVESLARYGVEPHQSTLERYRALVSAMGNHPELEAHSTLTVGDHHRDGVGRVYRGVGCSDKHRSLAEAIARQGDAGDSARTLIEELWGDPADSGRIDWRAVLREFLEPVRTRVATYKRAPRRFPKRLGETPAYVRRPTVDTSATVLVVIDTSLSVTPKELTAIAAELSSLQQFAKLTIIECDRKIQRIYPFEGTLHTVQGRGGTDLRPPFAAEVLAAHRPFAIVYFTDGEGPFPDQAPGIRTLWVLTKGEDDFECRWGKRVVM